MRIYRTLSVIVLSLLFVLCLTGAATAVSIVTQTGDNYTVILDPNLHTVSNGPGYDLVGTGGVVYDETSLSSSSLTLSVGDLDVTLFFDSSTLKLTDISTSIDILAENVTIDLIASSVGNPVNISITSAAQFFNADVIIEGNNHAFEMSDILNNYISIQNPNGYFIRINNLTLISTNNYEMPIQIIGYSSSPSVSIDNLNVTGLLNFSGSSYSLYIENSTFQDGGLKINGTSVIDSISFHLESSNFTNSSVIFGEYIDSSNIIGNRISNNSDVLRFSNVSFGVRHLIYNNYFEVDPSQRYVSINSCIGEIWFYCDDGIMRNVNIAGGPYIAGNYWSDTSGTGYSDSLSNSMGYVNASYLIPDSNLGNVLVDPHPLTKYAQSNSGGGSGTPLTIIPPQDPSGQDPSGQDSPGQGSTGQGLTGQGLTDQTPSGQDPSGQDPTNENGKGSADNSGRKGISGNHQLIQQMKENGQTLDDAIIPMSIGAAIVGISVSSILMMISNLVDLFFDVTSKQARKLKFKFRMPKLSSFLTANSAFSILFFFIGVCIVDMFLGDAVDASMDHGFLMPVAASLSPLIVMTIANIGGGLFLDEIMDFVLDKAGRLVNAKTGILDIIAANGNLNAIIVILIFMAVTAIVTFSIYLFDWTLI